MGLVKYPVLSWVSCVKSESDKLDSEARRGYNLSLSSLFLPLFVFHKCQDGLRRLDSKKELKRLPYDCFRWKGGMREK